MSARTFFVPQGHLAELRNDPRADRMAYTAGRGIFDDYRVTVYASRAALLAFCKDGSAHHALVKDTVPASEVINRNTQRGIGFHTPVKL